MLIEYSGSAMSARILSSRAPALSMPFSTSASSPTLIATLSCATRAGDLPSAIMILPQLGSPPLTAVLTSGEFATDRAASSASRRVRAPLPLPSTTLVAPSPSATSMRASFATTASSPRANSRRPRLPRSSGAFSASPFASTATVSLVDWSPSTVIRLSDPSTARLSTRGSASEATIASVARKQNIVARCGSSMPTPLAMPPIVIGRPPISIRRAASLSRVSVVMIASAALRPPWGERPLTSFGSAARILSIGSGWPITPVAAISTWPGLMRRSSPTVLVISRASLIPCSPVQTLEHPLEARMAWARPSRMCSCETTTGAPLTWLVVKMAAARAGAEEYTRARSFLPLGLMPAAMPEARMPGTAVMPPSSHCMSAMGTLRVHRWRFETRPLVPPHHDVEVLDAVGRAALAQVVQGRDADGAPRARIGDDGDVAEVGAGYGAGRRPLTLGQHPHEGLARVELAVEGKKVGRACAFRERHRGRGEDPAVERHKMRSEADHDGLARQGRKFLFHLRRVAVSADGVGLHVLVGLGVQVHGVDRPPLGSRPRYTRLAVYHDALDPPEPALEQRRRREDRAHGVAAGVGHERGARDGLPVQLRHAVHGFPEPRGVDVARLVPGRVERAVAQPVVGREIDDLAAVLPEDGHRALGFHVRQREEDEVGLVADARGVELAEHQRREAAQVREDLV